MGEVEEQGLVFPQHSGETEGQHSACYPPHSQAGVACALWGSDSRASPSVQLLDADALLLLTLGLGHESWTRQKGSRVPWEPLGFLSSSAQNSKGQKPRGKAQDQHQLQPLRCWLRCQLLSLSQLPTQHPRLPRPREEPIFWPQEARLEGRKNRKQQGSVFVQWRPCTGRRGRIQVSQAGPPADRQTQGVRPTGQAPGHASEKGRAAAESSQKPTLACWEGPFDCPSWEIFQLLFCRNRILLHIFLSFKLRYNLHSVKFTLIE